MAAGPDTGAPVLSFRAGVTGRHAIYVGAYGAGSGKAGARDEYGIYVRLSGDPHFTFLVPERGEPCYQEMLVKAAELAPDTRIEIGNFEKYSCLDYIKLVPVRDVARPAGRGTVIGILDFTDDADTSEPPGFEAGSAVRRHAEAGYGLIAWKAYAVRCEYHTRVGEMRSFSYSDEEIAKRAADEAIDPERALRGVGGLLRRYDTMRQAVEEARRMGLPIYGWARIGNEFARPNHQFSANTPFHLAHPEMRQLYADGRPTPRLSFAYPEVRRHKIDVLCEIAAYGMDGILVDVLRHPPMARYDLPLVEAFLEQTGRDPRRMEGDGDEEWLRFRAGIFTRFLREARAALDAQAGRHVPLMVRTVDQVWRNLQIGCDVEGWMEDGLVDAVLFAPHCATAENYPEHMDLAPYVRMARGRVKVYGQVWRYGSGIHAEVLAEGLYGQGVDGVALYESNRTVALPSMRERIWRLGWVPPAAVAPACPAA